MKRNAGFTLIELVIVIVILGILAVTAAPKFLNLQDDANKAAADGVRAAVASSAQIVYSRAVVSGVDTAPSSSVKLADGNSVLVAYGYPQAVSGGIGNAVQIDGTWTGAVSSAPGSYVYSDSKGKCVVTYTQATSAAGIVTAPTTQVTGC